jgi:hypothetical protein
MFFIVKLMFSNYEGKNMENIIPIKEEIEILLQNFKVVNYLFYPINPE